MRHSRQRPAIRLTGLQVRFYFLPFLDHKRLWLAILEPAAEHSTGPGEPHWNKLRQVAKTLLHSILAFGIAIKEHGYNAVAQIPRQARRFLGLLARNAVGAKPHRGDAKTVQADHIVGAFHQDQS